MTHLTDLQRRLRARFVLVSAVAAATLSCGQNQSGKPVAESMADNQLTPVAAPRSAPAGHPPMGGQMALAPAVDGVVDLSGGVTGAPPEGWRQVPPSSSMRVAEFELPGSGGAASVAIFAGTMGSVEDNVARWVGQFSGPDGTPASGLERTTLVVGEGEAGGGLKVVRVAVSGTFSGGMGMGGGGANPGYRMLGAIVERGSDFHYIKAVGPEATLVEQEANFDAFIASLRGS